MSCERYRSALIEMALGTPAPPALTAHLAECAPCRAILDERQRWLGRIDSEIRASLQATPSPQFLPRLRRRLEASPLQAWPLRCLVPAAALLGVAFVASYLLARRPAEPRSAPPHASVEEPRTRPAPSLEASLAPPASPRTAVGPRKTRRAARGEPDVLVPPEQQELVRRLVEARREDLASPGLLLAAAPETSALGEIAIAALRLPPLRIEPSDVKPLRMEDKAGGES